MIDVLLVSPNSKGVYQGLSQDFSAIETPIWCGLLANSVRAINKSAEIVDLNIGEWTKASFCEHVKNANPKIVLFVATGANPNSSSADMAGAVDWAEQLRLEYPEYKIGFVGPHVNALPIETLNRHRFIDFCLTNEGVCALRNLVNGGIDALDKVNGIAYQNDGCVYLNPPERIVPQDRLSIDLPGVAYDAMPDLSKYRTSHWHTNYQETRYPFASIYTSLGCSFTCLAGDTPVDTIFGSISIKELAEKYKTVPVYTMDFKTNRVKISDAVNICKTGVNKKLVRVNFDDGTSIDCTPDHKFMCFKNANQYVPIVEWVSEASNLTPGTRVRAINYSFNKRFKNRCIVTWTRRDNCYRARLVMEYKLGRQMTKKEFVHHIDHNPNNDHPDNLEFMADRKEHMSRHPEVAERMREDNPCKYWTEESKIKVSLSNTGKKRSFESRERYRESKLGTKNPNYKEGKHCNQASRLLDDVNHKVVSVEEIDGLHDVYCMTVPGHGWFYANKVLVKNCSFCLINIINRTENGEDKYAGMFNKFRHWEPSFTIKQLDYLANKGVRNIKIADELFLNSPKNHAMPLCDLIIERGYDFNIWCYTRVNTVKPHHLAKLKDAGVNYLAIGIENSLQKVRTEIEKGKFSDVDIVSVVKMIENAGINVIQNFIVGLPGESEEDAWQNLKFAKNLNCSAYNVYGAMALPGSQLYVEAKQRGEVLPTEYSQFGFLSRDCVPLSNGIMSGADILRIRDESWLKYHTDQRFLDSIRMKFGDTAVDNIKRMTAIPLKRRILGD